LYEVYLISLLALQQHAESGAQVPHSQRKATPLVLENGPIEMAVV
jgi:hypothetical protein